jgi:hypothetical protein
VIVLRIPITAVPFTKAPETFGLDVVIGACRAGVTGVVCVKGARLR